MRLAEYLKENDLTLDAFAAQIGRTAATVSRIARGVHKPDWGTMEAIRRATNDSVLPNDFVGEPDAEPATAHAGDKPSIAPEDLEPDQDSDGGCE